MSYDTTGKIPVITMAKDLGIFKRIGGNRRIVSSHVKKLVEAIESDTDCVRYNPILVNERYEVIDGQHRLAALEELGLPAYYIQIPGLRVKNAQDLNRLSKPWSPTDYAQSYVERGNKHYEVYLRFKKQYGLNHDVLIKYLALDDMSTMEMFRSGKFKVTDETRSHDLCMKLSDFGEFFDRYKHRPFAMAFRTIWQNPNYDHNEMIRRLRMKPNQLEYRAIPEDYIRDLETIYNRYQDTTKRVRFF